MFSFSPGFLPQSPITGLEGFSPSFHSSTDDFQCSTELASKKKSNCNVMITRPTNYMISTRDHSYDLLTWSQHMTYPDIKSISNHHWYQHPRHHFYVITISGLLICHVYATSTSWSLHHCSIRFSPIVDLGQVLGGLLGRQLPDSSSGGVRRGFSRLLLMKATGRLLPNQRLSQFQWWWHERGFSWSLLMKATGGNHGEWWAGRLARRSINPTLKDVNISFNHPPYYTTRWVGVTAEYLSISGGLGNKWGLVGKGLVLLDGPV